MRQLRRRHQVARGIPASRVRRRGRSCPPLISIMVIPFSSRWRAGEGRARSQREGARAQATRWEAAGWLFCAGPASSGNHARFGQAQRDDGRHHSDRGPVTISLSSRATIFHMRGWPGHPATSPVTRRNRHGVFVMTLIIGVFRECSSGRWQKRRGRRWPAPDAAWPELRARRVHLIAVRAPRRHRADSLPALVLFYVVTGSRSTCRSLPVPKPVGVTADQRLLLWLIVSPCSGPCSPSVRIMSGLPPVHGTRAGFRRAVRHEHAERKSRRHRRVHLHRVRWCADSRRSPAALGYMIR